jgi:hypothetical protein
LPLDHQASLAEFVFQAHLINALQQPWSEFAMNSVRRVYDRIRDLIYSLRWFSW